MGFFFLRLSSILKFVVTDFFYLFIFGILGTAETSFTATCCVASYLSIIHEQSEQPKSRLHGREPDSEISVGNGGRIQRLRSVAQYFSPFSVYHVTIRVGGYK